MYFLCGLNSTTSQFFIALGVTVLLTEICVGIDRFLAAVFRDISHAGMVAGLCVIDFALYAGYALPAPLMPKWWSWLRWWNPMNMAQEILATNEFRTLIATCSQLVPAGGVYETLPLAHRSCVAPGAPPGVDTFNGSDYLKLAYDCTSFCARIVRAKSTTQAHIVYLLAPLAVDWAHRWRLSGLMLGIWIGSVAAYAVACEFQKDPATSSGVLLYSRKAKTLPSLSDASTTREEATHAFTVEIEQDGYSGVVPPGTQPLNAPNYDHEGLFSFHNVSYDVDVEGETRRLLHDVTGSISPGQLTAIMGPSGSGKTTLMNVLAQRTKDVGIVSGAIMYDSLPLPLNFQQETGYCEQMDTHLSTATVREALQFSALLRRSTGSRAEKLAWCEEVINLLEMGPWADALIGKAGENEGLIPEQRKRLTIGVELAAKPKLLLFLDEPTSGMDALAARSIVSFLKRLASAGQSILCTIHQPSGELLAQFDQLLLLNTGRVVYNGPLHTPEMSCGAVLEYFEAHSHRLCGETNPAEFVMECIAAPPSEDDDWAMIYENSPMASTVQANVASVHGPRPPPDISDMGRSRAQEFGASLPTQLYQLLLRTWTHFWRSPSYLCSKFALNLIAGLFVGSSFWGAGLKSSPAHLRIRVFTHFVGTLQLFPSHFIYETYKADNPASGCSERARGSACPAHVTDVRGDAGYI